MNKPEETLFFVLDDQKKSCLLWLKRLDHIYELHNMVDLAVLRLEPFYSRQIINFNY